MSGVHRFVGVWELVSFETRDAAGNVTRPWGDDPVGTIIWTAGGNMSAQLGPRDPAVAPWVAYFGTLEVPDAAEGTLVHHVTGASLERLRTDQVRNYRFESDRELSLQPPANSEGATSTLRWRRIE
jgi:hypothetical protein